MILSLGFPRTTDPRAPIANGVDNLAAGLALHTNKRHQDSRVARKQVSKYSDSYKYKYVYTHRIHTNAHTDTNPLSKPQPVVKGFGSSLLKGESMAADGPRIDCEMSR